MARSIYEFRDRALGSPRRVFGYAQLALLFGVDKKFVKVYVHRMVKKGLARRLIEGRVAFTEDPFVVATQLVEPSYISLTTALHLRGLIQQVPTVPECVTTRGTRRFDDVVYRRINPKLFFGYTQEERGGSYVFLAEPEKAVLDLAYYGALYPLVVEEVVPALDLGRFREYAERFKETPRGRVAARLVMRRAQ
jgi:predicted transcriptional regulator of viral defense system